jgi:hypothetical protein
MKTVTIKDLGITFEIGQTYNNPKLGDYTVLSFNGNTMKVHFNTNDDSCIERELNIRTAAQIIFNAKCNEAKTMKSKSIGNIGNHEAIAFTIGKIAKYGKLFVCGLCDNKFEAFQVRYEKAAPRIENFDFIAVLHNDSNKWGTELSIYLPKDFDHDISLPEDINLLTDGSGFTINNNSFFWHLVEKLGFVLGDKQNIEHIADNFTSKATKEAFLKGAI